MAFAFPGLHLMKRAQKPNHLEDGCQRSSHADSCSLHSPSRFVSTRLKFTAWSTLNWGGVPLLGGYPKGTYIIVGLGPGGGTTKPKVPKVNT